MVPVAVRIAGTLAASFVADLAETLPSLSIIQLFDGNHVWIMDPAFGGMRGHYRRQTMENPNIQ
jgi:hypothetical protein